MDKLAGCACAFEKLLDIQYRIIIGRKGKSTELNIGFSKLDFHHLMGLGKLKDLRIATRNRSIIFDEILAGKTTYETIAAAASTPNGLPLPLLFVKLFACQMNDFLQIIFFSWVYSVLYMFSFPSWQITVNLSPTEKPEHF